MRRVVQGVLAAVVVVVLGGALAGVGQGEPPSRFPAPTGAELEASKQRIASGGPQVQEGREEFAEHGCGACHALAATGDDGRLGPRMDAQRDPVEEIAENIVEPREGIARGFDPEIMPTDYGEELSEEEVDAVAAFIAAASGGGGEDGDERGRGHERPEDDD